MNPPGGRGPEDGLLPDLPRLTGPGKGVGKEEKGREREGGGEIWDRPLRKKPKPLWRKCSQGKKNLLFRKFIYKMHIFVF